MRGDYSNSFKVDVRDWCGLFRQVLGIGVIVGLGSVKPAQKT